MHRVLVKNADYEIDWIDGCECLLAAIRNPDIGREGIDSFFRELKESRHNLKADSLALDLRAARRLPPDVWGWLTETWYPLMVEQGLKRQALVGPRDITARIQWRTLKVKGIARQKFDTLPAAIHWLGQVDQDSTPTLRRMAIVAP